MAAVSKSYCGQALMLSATELATFSPVITPAMWLSAARAVGQRRRMRR
jgi:hypothetical protein